MGACKEKRNRFPKKLGILSDVLLNDAMICCDLVAQTVIRGHAHTSLHNYFLYGDIGLFRAASFCMTPLRVVSIVRRLKTVELSM